MIDGTEQRDRLLPALKEGYFNVDELRFEQLVAMSARLASKLAFYDLDNKTEYDPRGIHADDSSWAGLFHNDEALLLAQIISRDSEPMRAVAMHGVDTERAKAIGELKADLKRWCEVLASTDYGQPVSEQIRQLESETASREVDERAQLLFLVAGLTKIQQLARAQLTHSLKSQSHDPASGLLIVFLQLYQKIQDQINRFADRHVDFYYEDCLHLKPKPGMPESVHLLCERDKATPEVTVHRGTNFIAPRGPDGQEVIYCADDEVVVTDAEVSALAELRLERNNLISPERELDYVTGAKQTWVDGDSRKSRTATGEVQTVFTGSRREESSSAAEAARIGLAIASPVLYLKEGRRDISITLWMSNSTEVDPEALDKIKEHQKGDIPLKDIFERYLELERKLLTPEEDSEENYATKLAELAKHLADTAKSRRTPKRKQRQDSDPESYPDPGSYYDVFLTELFLLETQGKETLNLRAGKLFSRWLLTKSDPEFEWLNEEELKQVRGHWQRLSHVLEGEKLDLEKPGGQFDIDGEEACRRLGRKKRIPPESDPDSSLDLLSLFRDQNKDKDKPPPREAIFNKLLNNIFEVRLTTATGWYTAKNALVVRPQQRPGRTRSGLGILVSLKPGVAPIVGYQPELHGGSWQTSLPVVRIRLRSDADLYPYSLLEDMVLDVVDLSVEVKGVRDAVLASDLGMLDPSKPFPPFGPLPRVGSYFVAGSPEVACKNPTSLKINIEWGGLPQDSGGFRKYYEGYDSAFEGNQIFKTTVSVLQDGSWQPQGAKGQTLPLFGEEASGTIGNQSVLKVDERALRSYFRSTGVTLTADGPELAPDAANGLVRLQLTEPAYAFGHAEYPAVLSRAARQSLGRRFKRKERAPNPPYTPVVQKLSIDYRAETSIRLNGESRRGDDEAGDKVFHLHPFGTAQIFPGGAVNPPLLPPYESGGNLFIGLRAADLKGKLTLLFDLKERAALKRRAPKRRFEWACLSGNRWKMLEPKQILSDTTRDFITSGIVTLDLPDDVTHDNTILPAGLFWLRVSDRTEFDTFGELYSVKAQALKAIRLDSTPDTTVSRHGTAMVPMTSLPGLLGVTQIGGAFGRRLEESRESMRARVGERLRHKNRAQTPWDYERLVLEHFPEVKKAKCYMSTRSGLNAGDAEAKKLKADDTVLPGDVVVVVLPNLASRLTFESWFAPGLNRLQLDCIEKYLLSVTPETASITVSNPVYERIQVRCALRLMSGCPTGDSVKRIEQLIVESISPWHDSGYRSPRFDWSIQAEDLEGWIEKLDCVESVHELALIQIVADDDGFHVFNAVDGQERSRVEAMLPGSIPISTDWHIIQLDDAPVAPTGISHMKVGDTFIIGRLCNGQ